MKIKSVVFILFLSLIITKCKKPDNDLVPNFTVLKDGNEWNPTFCSATFYLTNKEIEIHCLKRFSKYYEDELFNLSFHIKDIAEQMTVNEFNSTWLFVLGGDGISNRYNIVSDPINLIQIISFDTIKKQLTGTFNVKLLRDKFYQHPEDTMLFSDGKFSLKYLETHGYVNTTKSE
jgi:hypothetical protein